MPRHSPYALYSLNFQLVLYKLLCYLLLEFRSIIFSLDCCYSRFVKRFYPSYFSLSYFHLDLTFVSSWRIVVIHDSSERPFYIGLILIFLKQFFSIICSLLLFLALFGFQWTFAAALAPLVGSMMDTSPFELWSSHVFVHLVPCL